MSSSPSAPSAPSGSHSHSYPPTRPRTGTCTSSRTSTSSSTSTLLTSYLVNTATDSLHDLRLQVTQDPNPIYSETSSSKGKARAIEPNGREIPNNGNGNGKGKAPLRPIWFRERILTPYDEIVDNIVDANTALVAWTIHRPVRGWYIHLRSPSLPTGTAIPLRPARTAASDITSTPLTFSLGTTLNREFIISDSELDHPNRLKESIDEVILEVEKSRELGIGEDEGMGNRFTTISLDGSGSNPTISISKLSLKNPRIPTSHPQSQTENRNGESSNSGSGTTSSVSISTTGGHARKRSSGESGSHSTGLNGIGGNGSRKVSNVLREGEGGKLVRETLGEEEEEENEEKDQSSSKTSGRQKLKLKIQDREGGLTANENKTKGRGPTSDRPYSPIEPHSIPPSFSGNSHSSSRKDHISKPTHCSFLITDGPASTTKGWNLESSLAPGRILSENSHSGSRLSWARWIWGCVPNAVRPPLAFDTSKNFSLRWVDPPNDFIQCSNQSSSIQNQHQNREEDFSNHDEIGSRDRTTESDEDMTKPVSVLEKQEGRGIEVLKFEDRSGWWFWGNSKGRLIVQENVVKTLGLDRTFWIAVALAYLEFLEERDGYNAAADG